MAEQDGSAQEDGTNDSDSMSCSHRDGNHFPSKKLDATSCSADEDSTAGAPTKTMQLNINMLDSGGEEKLPAKENGPGSLTSRRSAASNPLSEIASTATNTTPRAFFANSTSKNRLLGEESQDEEGSRRSVSFLRAAFSMDSSKSSTTETKSAEDISPTAPNSTKEETSGSKDTASAGHYKPPRRLSTITRLESVRTGTEFLREAGTSFTDEGTSVVSSWLEDATATGIFRSLHVNSGDMSCGIPTPPSSKGEGSTTTEEPVFSLQASSSSSWALEKSEDFITPKNQSAVIKAREVKSASAIDMKQFDRAYDIWRRKGLMSDEKIKPGTAKPSRDQLFEPDPSVSSSHKSEASSSRKSKASSKGTATGGSLMLETPEPSLGVTSTRSSKLRRETLAVVPTDASSCKKDEPRKSQRQSLPAPAQSSNGFADILKSWKSKSDNKPCPHFLSQQQTEQDPTAEKSQSLVAKMPITQPPLQHRRVSAIPAVPPPTHSAPPFNSADSPVGLPPKSQAWKMKRQKSERVLSATSSAATKTAQNDRSLGTTSHWSFGRSSSRGRNEDDSGEVVDKYASIQRTSDEAKKNVDHVDVQESIDVSGTKTPTAENALQNFAEATNRLSQYFDPPRSVDSESTVTPTIPREVAITSPSLKTGDALLSPFTRRVVRNLEKMYNQADDVRTPAEKNFADRPWRRDSLVARVNNFQNDQCQCICSKSVFSGNDVMIDFFLPLMGTACTCGQRQPGLVNPNDPTSLTNILRPWQVEFLGSFGIFRGEELVKANHRSGAALAGALRKYRKKMGMAPFRTKSCGMALQIWSRTSKAFVRSIRSQLKATEDADGEGVQLLQARELRLPNALYIVSAFLDSMPSDAISQGQGTSAGCDMTLTSTITGSHSSGDGANWSTITPGATVEGEI